MAFETYLDLIAERTVGRYDAFALFDDIEVLEHVIDDFASPFYDREIDAVVGIDAVGFVLGTGVALELEAGFLPVRKGGKLPIPEDDRLQREVTDYTGERKTLEIDAGCVYHICDMVVHPDHQGQGLGTRMMDALMAYVDEHAPETAYVNLMADVDGFYERWGFERTVPASKAMFLPDD